MNETPLSTLSEAYLVALRADSQQGSDTTLHSAHKLGAQAVALGLGTLDLAKMHDQAQAALLPLECQPGARADMTARAELFFTEACLPIEKTRRTAIEACSELVQVNKSLGQLTQELTDSNRELQQGITERQRAEATLKISEQATGQLLKESRALEKNLQVMTRKLLTANEAERRKMSLHLHDEIAQSLLGIHVRLLVLKTEAAGNQTDLGKEITLTQQLVEQSVINIKRFAHENGIPFNA